MKVLTLPLLLIAAPAIASMPANWNDGRVRHLTATANAVLHVDTSPETTQTILVTPGERIASIILSDPAAYQISVSSARDSITLRANGTRALAMMSVQTETRAYEFELAAGNPANAPTVVSVSLAHAPSSTDDRALSPDLPALTHTWRLTGDRALRPATVSDDGLRTYIVWNADQAMPATFAPGSGGEQVVDGFMRDGVFTIDRVYEKLTFRIDRRSATATRKGPRP